MLHSIDNKTRKTISSASNSHDKAIKIATDPIERVLPSDLLLTENGPLKKVLTVLVFLCDEISQLKEIAESRFYRSLVLFGSHAPEVKPSDEDHALGKPGYKERMIGKFLPFLQELSNFVDRCYNVALNMVQQMSSLMNPKEALHRTTFNHTRIVPCFYALADLLAIMMSLDTIIQQNYILSDSWAAYKSMITYVRNDPSAFASTAEVVTKFERLLVAVDQSIMVGEIFQGCIEQNFEAAFEDDASTSIHINVRGNQAFLGKEYLYCLKFIVDNALAVVGTNSETNERHILMGCLGLYALYRRLAPTNKPPDQKLYKAMWTIQKTVPVVPVSDNIMWCWGDFLLRHASLDVKKLDPPNPEIYRRQYIQQFDQQLGQRTALLVSQCKAWMILAESRLQAILRNETGIPQLMDLYAGIVLKGLALCKRAHFLAKYCLTLHTVMQIPMTKNNLDDVALLVEILKAMEFTITRKDKVIAEALTHVTRSICAVIFSTVQPMRSKLLASRRIDNSQVIMLSTIIALENLVRSTDFFSTSRQFSLSLLILVLASNGTISNDKDSAKLHACAHKIVAVANAMKEISAACDTSFMFFYTDFLHTLVSSIYKLPTECNRLQYIFSAYADGIKLCPTVLHTEAGPYFVNYRAILRESLKDNIIQPLCSDIETDLRLHIHTKHLDHMEIINPKTENLRPLKPFLDLAPLRFLGLLVNIKSEVTHYLDMNFYNLTTIALHDWRTYSDMRSLALEKLGIKLMDNFLPMGSLEQGLDVLQIMRNIHIFVNRYTYNMNMQQFVEFRPEKASKHLNTIGIQSIAASIRQHGLGVLNTTVNFTYQFLSSKFNIFSQFLFDEHIRAHLSKEHRWFKKHKNDPAINSMYPHDRAMKFLKEIKKLGVNEAGKSYLDLFRILITEIGNALGYVRMVRSASMYYCSEAVKFFPDFDDIISFEDYAGKGVRKNTIVPGSSENDDERIPGTGAGLSNETVRAAANLDEVISTLVKNFGEGNDYFKVLVNVFQSVLLSAEHDHLKYFYIIGKCNYSRHLTYRLLFIILFPSF